jgi:hypothetical protein
MHSGWPLILIILQLKLILSLLFLHNFLIQSLEAFKFICQLLINLIQLSSGYLAFLFIVYSIWLLFRLWTCYIILPFCSLPIKWSYYLWYIFCLLLTQHAFNLFKLIEVLIQCWRKCLLLAECWWTWRWRAHYLFFHWLQLSNQRTLCIFVWFP